jgi:cell division protein FtsB
MRDKLIKGGLILIIIYLVVSFIRDSLELSKVGKRFERAKNEVEELRKENKELSEKKRWVESEDFVEEQLRNKLNMVKEGEAMVILPEDTSGEVGIKSELKGSGQGLEEKGTWGKWMELFF